MGGDEIFFLAGSEARLMSLSSESGTERSIASLAGKPGSLGRFALAADGNYLYFTWDENVGDIWVMDVVTE